jgi:hypothetical protein
VRELYHKEKKHGRKKLDRYVALGKAIYGEDIAKLKGSMRRLHFGNVTPPITSS